MGIGIDSMAALSHSIKIPLYLLLEPGFQTKFNFDLRLSNWKKYLRSLPNCEYGPGERLVFGRNFKAAREAIKYTQVQVFERTGIPDTTITLIERGTSGPEFSTALRLARCVGVHLFILFKP
jgi:DNA-binding XRE family transcriptional regulator